MKIKIINPNTTQAMTDGIREAALTVARPDTEIICVSPEKGPVSIENHHDEVYASVGVVEEVRKVQMMVLILQQLYWLRLKNLEN